MKVKSGKHAGAFVVNGSIVGYDEFKNHQKNVKWKYQHNTGIWLKEQEEMKKKGLRKVSAYQISDGRLFEDDIDAMEMQTMIDFQKEYTSNNTFANNVTSTDVFRWLVKNCGWLLSVVSRLSAIEEMRIERRNKEEDADDDCPGL